MKFAILGGGISGVAAARFLAEAGHDVDVFEKEREPGGLMRSDTVDGFVFDRAGGHILFTKSDWCRAFWGELFRDDELVSTVRNTKILYRGRFVHYPFENGIGDLEPEERLACLKGYVEAWVARRAGGATPDNFRDWTRHRFGDGIADGFMLPYNEKIWKVDLAEMGIDWVAGRVPDAPLDDVLRAAMGQRTEGYTHQIRFQYPLTRGFQEVFDRTAAPIAARLHSGTPVTSVTRVGDQYDVDGTRYDRVISTIPLPILAEVLKGWDSAHREAARALRHRGVTSVLYGIDAACAKPYSWIYLPHASQGPANRVTFMSNYSPRNAPEGRASVQAEVTHDGPLAVDQDFLEGLRRSLAREGLFDEATSRTVHWYSNEWAYILFDRDFTRKRAMAIEGAERLGVVPLGRFGRFDYHNSDQCLVAARECVDRILAEMA